MNSERYQRQMQLKGFGPEGQKALSAAAVLVVGAGGLGVPVSQALNAMGVGRIGLVDGDIIETSNLHRQPAYGPSQVGRPKVAELARWLAVQNPDTRLDIHDTFLNASNALDLFRPYDLVVDATDNLATRYLIDDAALIAEIPWVYGALHGYEGQVSVFNYRGGPTYRCLFPTMPGEGEIPDCNMLGTLGVLPGLIGNLQALETVKVVCDMPGILSGKLLLYNGLDQFMQTISFTRNPTRIAGDEKSLQDGSQNCAMTEGAVSASDYRELCEGGIEHMLVDVREPSEFELVHLPGSRNIPLMELAGHGKALLKATSIYFICKSGPRSMQAYQYLKQTHPSVRAFWISGGLRDFKPAQLDRL